MLIYVNVVFSQNLQHQQQKQQQNQPQQLQPKKQMPNIDDATLDKFIKAAQEIEKTKEKYMKEFQTKAEKDMSDILKKYGFDIQTYNQIGSSIGQNPELMKKVRQKLGK
jgi:DNA anti-recombination protein RmuC